MAKSSYKFHPGQTVVHKGETVTVTGINLTKKGPAFALSNGEAAYAKELSKVEGLPKEKAGKVLKTHTVPAERKAEAVEVGSKVEGVETETPSQAKATKTAAKKAEAKSETKAEKAE